MTPDMWKSVTIAVAALALAGCDATLSDNTREGVIRQAEPPFPPEVTASLPEGIGPEKVFVRDGCYFFVSQGRLIRLATDDAPDVQFCVG